MRRDRVLVVMALALALCAAVALSASAASRRHRAGLPPDWPGYHGGGTHAGVAAGMPRVHRASLARQVGLDGAVYASPIVVGGTIVVATENDSVYGLDRRGRTRWQVRLGSPSPASQRPCGNIDPLGITGTPVYDPASRTVYVVAETGTAGVRHTLVAINPATGHVRWRRSVDLPGHDPTVMQQRGALAIAGGRVWVTFGGLTGDCGDYIGRLVGVPLRGRGANVHYDVPTEREGGMWQPSGPAVDRHGHLYVSVGNGATTSGTAYDGSDSVIELTTRARVVGFFAPSSWAADNAGDIDLGSVGPALVGSRWVVQGGKSTTVYVLRQGALGGIGGQVSATQICTVFGGTAVRGSTVYLPCTDGLRAVRVSGTGQLQVLWRAASGAPGSPVVGGGLVWTLGAGYLDGLSPASGAVVTQVPIGATSRFATPAIYGRLLLVPTLTGVAFVRTR